MRPFHDLIQNAGSAIAAFVMLFATCALAASDRGLTPVLAVVVSVLIAFGAVQLTAALAGRGAPVWLFGLFVVAVVNLVARGLRVAVEVEGFAATLLSYAVAVMLVWLVSRVRLPYTARLDAAITIAAPRAVVWDAVEYRPRRDCWKPHVAQIADAPGKPGCVRQILRGAGDQGAAAMTLKVFDVAHGEAFALEVIQDENAEPRVKAIENRSWHRLSDVEGGTLYQTVEIAKGLSIGDWVFGALVNPALDSLRQLKAHVEGGEDRTFAASFAQERRIDEGSI